jgi:hypothetical protein
MPCTPPHCAKLVHGVYFVPVMTRIAGGKEAIRWQCLHPQCLRPLQAAQLKRHVSSQHAVSYNNFLQTKEVVALPDDWEDRLLGTLMDGNIREILPEGTSTGETVQRHHSDETGSALAMVRSVVYSLCQSSMHDVMHCVSCSATLFHPLLLHFPSHCSPLTCPAGWRPRPMPYRVCLIPIWLFFCHARA